MPHVNILGYGVAKFPDNIPPEDIKTYLQDKFTKNAINNPIELPQRIDIAAPVESTLRNNISQGVSNFLVDKNIISNRHAAQDIGKTIGDIGDFIPGIGDASAGDDFGRAVAQGNKLGIGLTALGVIPLVGKYLKKGAKVLSKELKNMKLNSNSGILNSDIVGNFIKPKGSSDANIGTIGQHGDLLKETIDGDKITAKYLIGKQRAGGGDIPGTPTKITGIATEQRIPISPKTRSQMGGFVGELRGINTSKPTISFDKNLQVEKQDIVKAHESKITRHPLYWRYLQS